MRDYFERATCLVLQWKLNEKWFKEKSSVQDQACSRLVRFEGIGKKKRIRGTVSVRKT